MARFLVRRILLGLLVLWVITTLVFIMFFVAPSNVARLIAGRQATPETVELVKHRLGLDRPAIDQYGTYLWNLVHGDLGYSFYNSESVRSLVWQRLPVTLSLAIGAALIWLVIGVSSGVLAATRPRSLADRVVTVTALFFYSMPAFLLGLIFLYFLFFQLHLAGIDLFPGSGYVPLTQSPLRWAQHLLLPWFTIALVTAALYSRLTRGAMLDVLGEDYIRTARAKGLRERRVVYRHGLRSAVAPVVTQFGIDLGTLLGGSVITETIFAWPGVGRLSVQAIFNRDYPVVQSAVFLLASTFVIVNFLVDIVYTYLDPRIRYR